MRPHCKITLSGYSRVLGLHFQVQQICEWHLQQLCLGINLCSKKYSFWKFVREYVQYNKPAEENKEEPAAGRKKKEKKKVVPKEDKQNMAKLIAKLNLEPLLQKVYFFYFSYQ